MPQNAQSLTNRLKRYCIDNSLSYHIETYGCQMNVRDSETLAAALEELGCKKADTMSEAGLIMFNTCCVRDHAEARVKGNVGALKEQKDLRPDLIVGVCGCMMQQDGVAEKFMRRYPFVDFLFGTHNISSFPEILAEAVLGSGHIVAIEEEPQTRTGERGRKAGLHAFVTAMLGCDNFCSYCIVPYVRGRERSRPMDEILGEIQGLVSRGTVALTLLGQNVNSYKHAGHGRDSFARLLDEVGRIQGIKRVGFMTSHPKDVPDSLLRSIADGAHMAKHIHLPVQSGSDAVLAAMNRGYSQNEYLRLAERIRETIPGVELTTDIIVGFPGETERDFLDTLELVERVRFASAYTFQYSPRRGTKAAVMEDQISRDVKKARLKTLNELQNGITAENSASYISSVQSVLIEGDNGKELTGKTASMKNVVFTGSGKAGEIVKVSILGARRNTLLGAQIEEGK